MNKSSPIKLLSLGLLAVFGISLILIFITKYFTFNNFHRELKQLSEAKRMPIEYPKITKKLAQQGHEKFSLLKKKLAEEKAHTSIFSINEINSMIQYKEHFVKIKNKIRFYTENNKLFAKISFPVNWFQGIDENIKYHYINGKAEFYFYIKKKVFSSTFLFLALKSFTNQSGKEFTSLSFISEQNLFGYLANTKEEYKEIEEIIKSVKSASIKNEELILQW